MDAYNTSFQVFIEERIKASLFHQAQVQVDMALDVEDCDLPMRIRDNRGITIQEHIDGMIQMGVDGLIDLDVEVDGLVKFDRDKMMLVAKRIAMEDVMAAFLAQAALMIQGYKLSPYTHTMLAQYIGTIYTEA